MKTILITGGAGFIGSHVVRLFVNKYPDSINGLQALAISKDDILASHSNKTHFK